MPFLNLDLDYFDHPKTRRLVGSLGRGADILPVRLWTYCGKFHAGTGCMTGYSPEDIETAIGWWGRPGQALEAMVKPFMGKPGFLECLENGYKVHDWESMNGHIHALKLRAAHAAKSRWSKLSKNEECMPGALPEHQSSIAPGIPPILPILTIKDKEEEKIKREPLKRFQPPTVSEISDYCQSRNNKIDAEKFWAFYESNGWKVGKNPMKSWHSAVITWEKSNRNGATNAGNQKSYPQSKSERLDKFASDWLAEIRGSETASSEANQSDFSFSESTPTLDR